MIDKNQADDKIIAVLNNDAMYESFNDITEVPEKVIERLKHYFLTYKDLPGSPSNCEITHTYGVKEAYELIERSIEDYKRKFDNLDTLLSSV
jgi:inorganic pyrophosphatase